ncbi:serine carboxypeptidase-like 35 [Syzygium oleosum]|uniref:serine carboxypeptidase-like 35 n=1 Tax=Syzygium oleosum TaxID=219896 RepID=UPI0011D1C08D|nr:serine carboxypeptidase-like 35 [Syzygium oleosum]
MGSAWMHVLFLLLAAISAAAEAAAASGGEALRREADRVRGLPGQPAGARFRHYAGYVELQHPDEHKALFYWFFEAQADAPRKPLVLWLNGGPGCSSVAFGAAQELGPFLVRKDLHNGTHLVLNRFSWNRVANLLFLEAPVGVGFSYTNRSEDLSRLGDHVTAGDSHSFLMGWFQRFPSFRSHDFYIAGESYAGHYVPQLAEVIYERNKGGHGSFINLKGFMIGNAVINDPTDTQGLIDYAWSHAIISDQLHDGIFKECDFSSSNMTVTLLCSSLFRDFLVAYSDIDIYSIYTPVCDLPDWSAAQRLTITPRLLAGHDLRQELPSGYDPCTEEYVEEYFNRKDVQIALHANLTGLPYRYTTCSRVIKGWKESADTILPIIRKLLDAGLRIWIYSGDTDGRVPVTSTRYSVKEMKLRVKEEWRAWFHKQQVAGWVEIYEGGLTLATVRGAGHQVPVFAPDQSLSLFTHFLATDALPSTRR